MNKTNNMYKSEEDVLKKLDIPDFRHVSKEKLMSFASSLPDMDPNVAARALEQMPNYLKYTTEILTNYKANIENILEKDAQDTKRCAETIDKAIGVLEKVLEKDNLSSEDQRWLSTQVVELARMMQEVDKTAKKQHIDMAKIVSLVVFFALSLAASIIGVNIKVNIPKSNSF